MAYYITFLKDIIMKRDIKFRAWDIAGSGFVPISHINTDIDNSTLTGIQRSWSGKQYIRHEIVLEQFSQRRCVTQGYLDRRKTPLQQSHHRGGAFDGNNLVTGDATVEQC